MPAVKDDFQIISGEGTSGMEFLAYCGLIIEITHIPSGKKAHFVGALTGLDDSFTSEWKAESVYGRMDPISTFQRTGRVLNMSWTILNDDAIVGKQNMRQIQRLINFLYPSYDSATGGATTISAAPLLKLKFTNLVGDSRRQREGLVGYAAGFNFKPNLEAGWVQSFKDDFIPQELEASLSFTVLHTTKLGWSGNKLRNNKFPYGDTGFAQAKDSKSAVPKKSRVRQNENGTEKLEEVGKPGVDQDQSVEVDPEDLQTPWDPESEAASEELTSSRSSGGGGGGQSHMLGPD
jgi:hypothetical protein